MNEIFDSIPSWLATDPLGPMILLAAQVGLVACIAACAARVVAKSYPGASHSVWLAAVMLSLLLFGASTLRIGWPVQIRVAETVQEASIANPHPTRERSERPAMEADASPNPNAWQAAITRSPVNSPDQLVSEQPVAELPVAEQAVAEQAVAEQAVMPVVDTSPSVGDARSNAVDSNLEAWFSFNRIAFGVYLGGLVLCVFRLIRSALRLHWVSLHGEGLDQDNIELAADFARHIGLKRVPSLRTSPRVTMPLVFGVIRPTVLLPADFSSWTLAERRATLVHELTHIRRRDLVGHFLSLSNRCIYWFHPASWLFHRRLTESREWATDREIVDRPHQSLSPAAYAESLLSVVSRLSRSDRRLGREPALAMASHDDIETRLHIILEPARSTRPRMLLRQFGIGVVVLVALGTSVRLSLAPAQEPPAIVQQNPSEKTAATTADSGDSNEPSRIRIVPLKEGEQSLFRRINDATVRPTPASKPILTMDVTGSVVDSDGNPVADAIVLLRESSTTRISVEYAMIEKAEDLYLREVADVLARTKSDAAGRFAFREIDAPGFSRPRDRTWTGDVVAAHPEFGICSVRVRGDKTKRQQFNDLQAVLRKTTILSGTYSTPEGEPIAGAVVTLSRLANPAKSERWYEGFDLMSSQLTLRTVTNQAGKFEFEQVPTSMLATLSVHDPGSAGTNAVVGTSPDIQPSAIDPSIVPRTAPLVDRPHKLVADPGIVINGIVRDEAGAPIEDAIVMFGGLVLKHRSDATGKVTMRVPTATVESYRKRVSPVPTIRVSVFADTDRGYMPAGIELPIEDIDRGAAFEVTLKNGLRVDGAVTDPSGEPIEGIVVMNASKEIPMRAQTDAEGRYEMLLPAGKHTLIFASDAFGFRLPRTTDAYRRRDNTAGLLTLAIELSEEGSKKLPTTVVPMADTIQVIASLPDGGAAKNANAVVRDEETRDSARPSPPRVVDRSSNVLTNSLGRADLPIRGVMSNKAYVDISLVKGDVAYQASAKVSKAVDGVLPVVLRESPILEGRVLIDEQPFPGVVVSIAESRPMTRSSGGRSFGAFTSTNHRTVTTDAEGYYRLPVARDQRFSISISSIPGDSMRPGVGFGASTTGAGKVTVKEFHFRRGSETIAGRVIDSMGAPVAEARVQIQRQQNISPSFWMGHYDNSTMTTNAEGFFELKNVPRGTYQLRISGKRPEDRSQRAASTMVSANTGQRDLKVTLSSANAVTQLPRLKPLRIEKVVPEG